MNNNRTDIEKLLKKHGFESIDDLKRQKISTINKFMQETGLSYFEVFFESEIPDIREYIEKDKIKIVRIKNGSKRPQDLDYYNKSLTWKEILSHNGNFGVSVGYNHSKGKSLACIDIDGLKIGKLSKTQKSLLSHDQVQSLENLTEERIEEITQESKNYLLTCILSVLHSAMVSQTQSGGYHIFSFNETHLNQDLEDIFHYVSKRLRFPLDCPIPEIRGLPLFNSLEIFTKFETKQCILPGSFIKNLKKKETRFYKLMDVVENTRKLSELGTVKDINETVKSHLISLGFGWEEHPVQESDERIQSSKAKQKEIEDRLTTVENSFPETHDILLKHFPDGVEYIELKAIVSDLIDSYKDDYSSKVIAKKIKTLENDDLLVLKEITCDLAMGEENQPESVEGIDSLIGKAVLIMEIKPELKEKIIQNHEDNAEGGTLTKFYEIVKAKLNSMELWEEGVVEKLTEEITNNFIPIFYEYSVEEITEDFVMDYIKQYLLNKY